MRYVLILLLFITLAYPQFESYPGFSKFSTKEEFNPVSATTAWSWQGKVGKTLEVDSVTAWVDQKGSYSATMATDKKKPLNFSNYVYSDSTDYLTIASPATGQNLGTGDFTISGRFWVNDPVGANYLFGKYFNSQNEWEVYVTANDLRLVGITINTNRIYIGSLATSNLISARTVYTFTITCDRDNSAGCIVYLNGVAVATTVTAISATDVTLATAFNLFSKSAALGFMKGRLYWAQKDNEVKDATWALNFHNYLVANGY